jgi:hypothetical protein
MKSLVTNQSAWLTTIPAKTRAAPFAAVPSGEVTVSDMTYYKMHAGGLYIGFMRLEMCAHPCIRLEFSGCAMLLFML